MTKTADLPTRIHGETVQLRWSSLAEEPAFWLSIEGGESIDPRDPKHLARLPITNSTLLNSRHARKLAAELLNWADELDQELAENGDAYLGSDPCWD